MLTSMVHLPAIFAISACSGPGDAAFMYFSIISFSFGPPAGAAAGAAAGLAASAGFAAAAAAGLAGSSARATGAKTTAATSTANMDDFFMGVSLVLVSLGG